MTADRERDFEAKARAVLERLFGPERAAEVIAASPVPLAQAFGSSALRDLPLSEWLAAADRLKRRAPAEVHCCDRRAGAERERRIRAARRRRG